MPLWVHQVQGRGTLGEQAKAEGSRMHACDSPERTTDPPEVEVIEMTSEGEPLESRTPEMCGWMFHKNSPMLVAIVDVVGRVDTGEWGMGGDTACSAGLD